MTSIETDADAPFRPPRPSRLPAVAALARAVWRGDGNLLDLLPAEAYSMDMGALGWSRRSIILVNDPALIREAMQDDGAVFPKSDLMVGALEPLIGRSIFVTDGAVWRRQRAMIDPAFSGLRLEVAFDAMQAAADAFLARLDGLAARGETFSLDLAMSQLTADVICRTVFSTPLDDDVAREVFEDFAVFEREVAQTKIVRLIVDPAFAAPRQRPEVLAACRRIRARLGDLIDGHLADPSAFDDIASAVIAARDADTGAAFTRDELIDQLGVFFLAGHETSASGLTWAFHILAARPDFAARIRAEADALPERPSFADLKRLAFVRAFFRETLRLYPPITFMPRVAMQATRLGGRRLRRGALVMVSPWTLHRNAKWWPDPDRFDPGRFLPPRERTIPAGAYIPFGLGPHICVGAGFAAVEASLMLARIPRAFDFEAVDGPAARPAARLTTRPVREIAVRARRRAR